MKTAIRILVTILLFCHAQSTILFATGPLSTATLLHPKNWAFEENMGQLNDQSGNKLSDIKYFGSYAGVHVYCFDNQLSFVFIHALNSKVKSVKNLPFIQESSKANGAISASRIDMRFINANKHVQISGSVQQQGTVNYANAHTPEGGLNDIPFFQQLTYINLYNNIDMLLIANEKGLEYEFIVHPGGNVADIEMMRDGAVSTTGLKNGGIHYETALGKMDEGSPQSYTGSSLISSRFIKKGTSIGFKTEAYDHNKDLVIDPSITWATYFGNTGDDEAYAVVLDASDNIYITGLTNSTTGIATKGAYQTSLAGGTNFDAFIAKFTSAGKLSWATYFGGDSADYGKTCALDGSGNLYVTGYTLSPSGIATKGAYQTSLGGGSGYYDAFLAKFTSAGKLTWSTYFGGSSDDYGYNLAVDASGNSYLCGFTGSSDAITTKGAHQTSFAGGNYDAYIAKFNSSGSRIWATYFGGSNDDFGTGIVFDKSKNIYLSGSTSSTSGIATKGAYKTTVDSLNGNAFLAAFDSNGVQKWGTYYGGNGGTSGDLAYSLATNGKSDLYITGSTTNSSGIATAGAYQTIFAGSSDVFLADFKTTGALSWGTYYGGMYDETGEAVSTDSTGNIYLAGYTSSDTGIATSGAYQLSLGNLAGAYPDAFLAKFNSNGALKYGTYFGGSGYDFGYGVANDNSGDIFVTGLTSSTNAIATSGAFQTSNGGGYYDAFLAQFNICTLSSSILGPTGLCVNAYSSYKALLHTNSIYQWTVSGGSIVSGAKTDSIVVKWGSTGKGTVKVREVNSLIGCLDSETISVTISPLPNPAITGVTSVCAGNSSAYHVSSAAGVSYKWTVTGGFISSAPGRDSIIVLWQSSPGKGTVAIQETNAAGCAQTDTIAVNILSQNMTFKLIGKGKGAYTFKAVDSVLAQADYAWVFGDGGTATGNPATHTYQHNGSYAVVLKINNPTGCSASYDSTIIISNAGIAPANTPGPVSIYPNPFNNQTEVRYSLPNPAHVAISVCDMMGKTIAVIQNNDLPAGTYTSVVDARLNNLIQGVYFIKFNINGNVDTYRIVCVKD